MGFRFICEEEAEAGDNQQYNHVNLEGITYFVELDDKKAKKLPSGLVVPSVAYKQIKEMYDYGGRNKFLTTNVTNPKLLEQIARQIEFEATDSRQVFPDPDSLEDRRTSAEDIDRQYHGKEFWEERK